MFQRRSMAAMSSAWSQMGTSTAIVVKSLASMKRCKAAWRAWLLPVVGNTSAAVRVAVFSFGIAMRLLSAMNGEAACEARALARKSAWGH